MLENWGRGHWFPSVKYVRKGRGYFFSPERSKAVAARTDSGGPFPVNPERPPSLCSFCLFSSRDYLLCTYRETVSKFKMLTLGDAVMITNPWLEQVMATSAIPWVYLGELWTWMHYPENPHCCSCPWGCCYSHSIDKETRLGEIKLPGFKQPADKVSISR